MLALRRLPTAHFSQCHRRLLTTTPVVRSKIGRQPIVYPTEVTITHDPTPNPSELGYTVLTISGPLGTHAVAIKPYIRFTFEEPNVQSSGEGSQESERRLAIAVEDATVCEQRQMWGTTRALIANYVMGVTEGHTVKLRLEGVGYRAQLEERQLTLRIGNTHPNEMQLPEGVQCQVPRPNRLVLTGSDRRCVMQFAAEIRALRKPEPFNQKGIFVGDETIRKKSPKKR